jgi:hypothetical protein
VPGDNCDDGSVTASRVEESSVSWILNVLCNIATNFTSLAPAFVSYSIHHTLERSRGFGERSHATQSSKNAMTESFTGLTRLHSRR